MAFWKKSEDPWDLEPDKRRPAAEEEEAEKGSDDGSLLQDLRAWNETRKAEKARRETPPVPIPCPWCGKEMEVGYLCGGRDYVRLVRQRPGLLRIAEDALSPGPARTAASWWQTCRSRRRHGTMTPCAARRRQTNTREKTDSWHSYTLNMGPWAPARRPTP